LLKYHAHVFATQTVALHIRQTAHVPAQHFAHTRLHGLHACEQGQQSAFTAAAGALNEQMLALRQGQFIDMQQRRLLRPSVA